MVNAVDLNELLLPVSVTVCCCQLVFLYLFKEVKCETDSFLYGTNSATSLSMLT